MKIELKLDSVGKNTVGGPEASAISLIYTILLREFKVEQYSYIFINHITEDLKEVIIKDGKGININIIYPINENLEKLNEQQKNLIRLEIIHLALLRIADYENKIQKETLESIKKYILEKKFSFNFILKRFINPKNTDITICLIVHPEMTKFNYFFEIKRKDFIQKQLIYSSLPSLFVNEFFSRGKWVNKNKIIVSGKQREVEFHITIDPFEVKLTNLTKYDKPLFYEMMRADISEEERQKVGDRWRLSLPPAIKHILDQNFN